MDLFAGFCSPSKTGPDCCPTSNGAAVRSFQSQEPRRPVGRKASPGRAPGSADARGDGRKESRAGIGIIVALNPDSSLYVHTVCAGATAEGLLHAGDVLLEVDGQDVFRAPAPHVADLLLGPAGTKVALRVRRSANGKDEHLDFSVTRARTDPNSARKAVYEAFLSTSTSRPEDGAVNT